LSSLVKEEGLRGLTRGLGTNTVRFFFSFRVPEPLIDHEN